MSDLQIEEMIEQYLKSVRRALPDSLDSIGLIDELREHIHEALSEKVTERPEESPLSLLHEVLDETGQPIEIAHAFEQSIAMRSPENIYRRALFAVLRLVVVVGFILLVAWYIYGASTNPPSGLDFPTVVVVLLILTLFEYVLRSWQSRRTSE